MRKVLCIILSTVMLLSVLALAACTDNKLNNGESETPTLQVDDKITPVPDGQYAVINVDPDYFRLLCENTDYYFNEFSTSTMVSFYLISAFTLTGDSVVDITFDQEAKYGVDVSRHKPQGRGNPIYSPSAVARTTYNYDNWSQLADELASANDIKEAQPLIASTDYEVSKSDNEPKLNVYRIKGNFFDHFHSIRETADYVKITKLTITVDGRSRSYDCGSIVLDKREETNQENSAFELQLLGSNRFEKLPTADGKISDTTGYDAKAYANVTITDIRAASEGIKVISVTGTRTTSDGFVYRFSWTPEDKKPLKFTAQDQIEFDIELQSDMLVDHLYAECHTMILFCLGNQYDGIYGHFEFSVCMKPVDIYMIHLWLDCGKDAITYYIEYLPTKERWEKQLINKNQ